MTCNAVYGDYVPDNCYPIKLSKEFLLPLVAYFDPFREFYDGYKKKSKRDVIKSR